MKEQSIPFRKGLRNFARLIGLLSAVPLDEEFMVTVGPIKKERSDLQNRALWGCAYKTIREATGNDLDDLHTYFCGEYFGWSEYEVMGKKRKRPRRSTTKDADGKRDVISTLELSNFYGFIQQRAAETVNVYVPDPDPMWWSHDQRKAA
ncbi:MAG TPA: hypothetical protein VGN07_01510 [Steroidobacteraceae bacterium]|jgi:hypothetical protein